MKIVIVSDNHGRLEPLNDIRIKHQDADIFIHCGDSEMPAEYLSGYIAVKGNNDYYDDYPDFKVVECGSHRLFVTHGHRMLYLNNRDILVSKAKSLNCDLVAFGHTHIFETRVVDGVTLINPGSLSRNRDGSPTSYAIVDITGDTIKTTRFEYKFDCKV